MPLTPDQRAIVRKRALGEMRHRSVGAGFRPAVLRGDWSETARKGLRADALSRRAEAVAGSHVVARDPHGSSTAPVVIGVLAVATGIALGYALGKWLKSKPRATVVGGTKPSRYLTGIDVLVAGAGRRR